jgi:hypothetical protein
VATVKLSKALARKLAKLKRVTLHVSASAADAAGNATTKSANLSAKT